MCGRFTQEYSWAEVHEAYQLVRPRNLQAGYNLAPTDEIDIVVADSNGDHDLIRARWGLIPYWWKKPLKQLPATFNARSDSVADKPMFRDAFREKRCIVPASGFYEWTGPKDARQPWYITPSNEPLLHLAGLWSRWRDRDSGEDVVSATIIVCDANPFMQQLHSRMPVILADADIDRWLSTADADLLRPAPEGGLKAWTVSPKINSSRYKEADATRPIDGDRM